MTYSVCFLMIGTAVWLTSPWKKLQAQDDQQKTITAKGLTFNIPEDWPIEERGGAVGPIPVEEYITIKFRKVQQQFAELEGERGDFEKDLESVKGQMEELKKTVSDMDTRLGDLEQWLKFGNARKL